MDYKEKYENGLECIQEILSGAGDLIRTSTLRKRLQPFFPELKEKENEDEQMIERLKSCVYASDITPEGREEILAWLEKQGEKKPADKVEPKKVNANKVIGWVNPDKVIEWLNENVADFWANPCNPNRVINQFKKDFGL